MEDKNKSVKEHRFCPYCDEEIAETPFPSCQACGVTIFYCPKCREPLSPENRVCPHCGVDIRKEAAKEE